MYYEEKIINDKLYSRTSPDGNWELCSLNTVTNRLIESQSNLKLINNKINNLINEHLKNSNIVGGNYYLLVSQLQSLIN